MKQGEVILVPFPFTDLTSVKTRPALVVGKPGGGKDIIVAAITSKKSKFAVEIDDEDLASGALPVKSYVMCGKIVTLEKSIVRKKVANLKSGVLKKILTKVRSQF